MRIRLLILAVLMVSACTPPPPIEQSRGIVWQRWGNHSVDDVLLAWGAPAAETKLTKGTRLVSYRRSTVYDDGSPYANATGCEVSFLAPPPHFVINNIAMTGSARECAALAAQGPGATHYPYVPPPPPPGFWGFYR